MTVFVLVSSLKIVLGAGLDFLDVLFVASSHQ